MGKQVTDPHSALAALSESPGTSQPDSIGGRLCSFGNGIWSDRLTLILCQVGFRIKCVHVTGTTIHEAENHIFCTCCLNRQRCRYSGKRLIRQQSAQRQPSETAGCVSKESPARRIARNSARTLWIKRRGEHHLNSDQRYSQSTIESATGTCRSTDAAVWTMDSVRADGLSVIPSGDDRFCRDNSEYSRYVSCSAHGADGGAMCTADAGWWRAADITEPFSSNVP